MYIHGFRLFRVLGYRVKSEISVITTDVFIFNICEYIFFIAAGIGCLTYYYYNPVLMENVNAHIAMVTKNRVE